MNKPTVNNPILSSKLTALETKLWTYLHDDIR